MNIESECGKKVNTTEEVIKAINHTKTFLKKNYSSFSESELDVESQ
jgi:hypothetical protein